MNPSANGLYTRNISIFNPYLRLSRPINESRAELNISYLIRDYLPETVSAVSSSKTRVPATHQSAAVTSGEIMYHCACPLG